MTRIEAKAKFRLINTDSEHRNPSEEECEISGGEGGKKNFVKTDTLDSISMCLDTKRIIKHTIQRTILKYVRVFGLSEDLSVDGYILHAAPNVIESLKDFRCKVRALHGVHTSRV